MRTLRNFTLAGCAIQSVLLIAYTWLATLSIDYISNYFGTELHWIVDLLIGLVVGWASIFIAVILLIFG